MFLIRCLLSTAVVLNFVDINLLEKLTTDLHCCMRYYCSLHRVDYQQLFYTVSLSITQCFVLIEKDITTAEVFVTLNIIVPSVSKGLKGMNSYPNNY